ncbi:MAG: hypothetical protein KDI42_02760 [Gammaproteobacteria bacterium]|nr:hypothetical protein [Gammaproteobacteria bacterium]MCP5142313.1 hypothetical protein [Gammaproteobacteria bacterium]MCP5230627.1 hypothetical protein [Zoogloeaceae bacterium]MCP5352888.1 hypothetical protein [Chromatiales bacterium]MCP5438868.1 hypothetical protein [Chromatiaceae bacterium]
MRTSQRSNTLLGLATVAVLLISGSTAVFAGAPVPILPEAVKSAVEGERSCVRPAQEMRRSHMDDLKHQRDDTVHEGVRTKRFALKECIDCHVTNDANGEKVSIKSREHFCNACHSYTGVTLDCWDCHASQPGGGQ